MRSATTETQCKVPKPTTCSPRLTTGGRARGRYWLATTTLQKTTGFCPLAFPRFFSNNGVVLTRNNIRLTLEAARAILGAAEMKARAIKVPQNMAVVDEGGHLLVFARMDGAKLSSVEVALTKARAAALRRAPTGPSPASGTPSVLLSLGLPLATDGKLTCIRGGLPLVVDGQHVGGIGVSAGTEDDDVAVAQAGVEELARISKSAS